MFGVLILAGLLGQTLQGPRALDIDPAKIQPAVVVPAGTVLPIRMGNRISSKHAKPGDGIYGRTAFPITSNNLIVVPEGSYVRGKITEVKRPGRVKGKPELALSFQTLILPNGTTIPLYSSLNGAGDAGEKKGETSIQGDGSKSEDLKTVGTTAVQGALIGVIARRGTGAAVGGAGGAAVGGAAVLLSRGKDLVIDAGTVVEIVLDRPIEP